MEKREGKNAKNVSLIIRTPFKKDGLRSNASLFFALVSNKTLSKRFISNKFISFWRNLTDPIMGHWIKLT